MICSCAICWQTWRAIYRLLGGYISRGDKNMKVFDFVEIDFFFLLKVFVICRSILRVVVGFFPPLLQASFSIQSLADSPFNLLFWPLPFDKSCSRSHMLNSCVRQVVRFDFTASSFLSLKFSESLPIFLFWS